MKKIRSDFSGRVWAFSIALLAGMPVLSGAQVTNSTHAGSGPYATIQAAINNPATVNGDVITVAAGNYTETINVTKAVTLNGPNSGIAGTGVRSAEAVLLDGSMVASSSGPVKVDGFDISQTNATMQVVLLSASANATIQNCIFERNGALANQSSRAVVTSSGPGVKTIQNNLFTGSLDGGLFSGHKTWNSAIYVNGGGGAVNILNNTMRNCRTALNLDDYNAGVTVAGNTFDNCGTFFSFGGASPTTGQFILGANDFKNPVDAIINLSNVTTAFRLDMTTSTLNGSLISSYPLSTLFNVEAGMYHRGRSGRNGLVYFVPATEYVVSGLTTIQSANDYAAANDIVNVKAGTYNEDILINKSITLLGGGYASTTVSGPIGGNTSTMQVAAGGVVIDGFFITRDGNNTTDWNNSALNSAGVAVQGQGNNAEIRNCKFSGNRTGIDVNNSNGNNIHDNIIDDNRTGLLFRNQTDNTNLQENYITNNWTLGVLFIDGSGGTNTPPQQAHNSTFNNNTISGNWYGDVEDRQSGGALPAPGTNLKNFSCNWYGAATQPATSTSNSTEPGYGAQIPVAYGGTAVPPGGQPNILGPASANISYHPWLLNGTDNAPGTIGFQPAPNSCGGGIPKLSTSINSVIVNANNDGVDDHGSFEVCNTSNNILFNSFTDQNGLSDPLLKVYQTYTVSNVTVPFCNNCNAPMAAFTGATGTAALVDPALPGTLTMRFKSWIDANNDNVVDPGEYASDWIEYTISVDAMSAAGPAAPNASVCAGNNSGTLSVDPSTVVGSVIKWQYSNDNFSSDVHDIANTTTSQGYLNLTQTTYYRMVVQNGVCSQAYSGTGVITVGNAPLASIAVSGDGSFCNSIVLTGGPSAPGNTFTWTYPNASTIHTQSITLNTSSDDGIYTLVVSSALSCPSAPVTYNFQKQGLVAGYGLIGITDVNLGESNTVLNGSVGVTSSNGHADFEKNCSVASPGAFVKATNITVKTPSNIPTRISSPAVLSLPAFLSNTSDPSRLSNYNMNSSGTLNGNYRDLTIKGNITATINGNLFNNIKIQKGANVTFTASDISAASIDMDESVTLGFAGNTALRIYKNVNVSKSSSINPAGNKVTFYLDDSSKHDEQFTVDSKSTTVIANVFMPTGKIEVHGGGTAAEAGSMVGQYIADEVKSTDKFVNWYTYNCYGPSMRNTAPVATFSGQSSDNGVLVYPNPTTGEFTLQFPQMNEAATVQITDMQGRLVQQREIPQQQSLSSSFDLSRESAGIYMLQVQQGGTTYHFKLVRR